MDYYTKQEVADLFGVSLNTIANWLKKGKIKKIEPYDRPMRFNKQEIDKMLDWIVTK